MKKELIVIIDFGGPNSCYAPDAATCSPELFELEIPVLGLCYGAQLMSHPLGCEVKRSVTCEYAIALRAVETIDFMTAEVYEIPYEVLKKVSNRIINKVSHVNRVLFDITSKPSGS